MATKALKLEKKQAPKEPEAPKEVRLPLKKLTRDNLEALNQNIGQARAALALAEQRFLDSVRPLMTEAGVEGIPRQITDTEPYELVIEVTK